MLASASQDGKIKLWSATELGSSRAVGGLAQERRPNSLIPLQADNDAPTAEPIARPSDPAQATDEPGAPKKRMVFDFRTKLDDLAGVSVFGPHADEVMKTDAQGLRITLPADRPDCNNVGIELPLRLRGDFDIELGYELLAIGAPIPNPGAGLHMRLQLDNDTPVVALTRLMYPYAPRPAPLYGEVGYDGDTFAAFRIGTLPNGNETGFSSGTKVRAQSPRGRLRLMRTGSVLRYLVADGGLLYHEIKSEGIGNVDVVSLRLFGFSGWGPVAVDVRFTGLEIRADDFPDGIPGPLDWSRATLPALLLAGLVLSAGVVVWLWVRHRRRAALQPV
jgi:hypothetical protein